MKTFVSLVIRTVLFLWGLFLIGLIYYQFSADQLWLAYLNLLVNLAIVAILYFIWKNNGTTFYFFLIAILAFIHMIFIVDSFFTPHYKLA